MLSGYLDSYHGHPGFHGKRDHLVRPCTERLRHELMPCIDYRNESGPSFGEYAAAAAGTMTRILTTTGSEYLHSTTPATWRQWRGTGRLPVRNATDAQAPGFTPLPPNAVSTALKALRQMRFVGITEHWDTSICLWHLQFPSFGARCLPAELRNVRSRRPGCSTPIRRVAPSRAQCEHARKWVQRVGRTPQAERDEEYRDEEDEQVYEEALRIFNERVARYGASRQRCLEMGCTSTTSTVVATETASTRVVADKLGNTNTEVDIDTMGEVEVRTLAKRAIRQARHQAAASREWRLGG